MKCRKGSTEMRELPTWGRKKNDEMKNGRVKKQELKTDSGMRMPEGEMETLAS